MSDLGRLAKEAKARRLVTGYGMLCHESQLFIPLK